MKSPPSAVAVPRGLVATFQRAIELGRLIGDVVIPATNTDFSAPALSEENVNSFLEISVRIVIKITRFPVRKHLCAPYADCGRLLTF